MPKPENPEGPESIKIDNIPSEIRKKMWLLKRINAIVGGPTDYKTMVIDALDCYVNKDPENLKKLQMAEMMLKEMSKQSGQGGGEKA